MQDKNNYDDITKIGRGAYGTVYKARNNKTGQYVALKKICVPLSDDGVPINTLREIGLLKQLNIHEHPNIVRFYDILYGPHLEKEMIFYLVFEHVEQDLSVFIEKNPRGLSTNQVRQLSREMLEGVDFLHSKRIVHRDLKPQNILVTQDCHIKIADFGLAKTYDFDMKLTSVVVTLWYRAPEVLLSLPYATPVDIWSIGCIIVELYTLKPLFAGTGDGDQLAKIFKVIGKPSESEWPKDQVTIDYNSFQIKNPIALKDLVPNLCENGLDLVTKMLSFDSSKRISALAALNHLYFTEEPMNT